MLAVAVNQCALSRWEIAIGEICGRERLLPNRIQSLLYNKVRPASTHDNCFGQLSVFLRYNQKVWK